MRQALLAAALFVSTSAALSAQPLTDVQLSRAELPDTARFFGTKTLSWVRVGSVPTGWPAEWRDAEAAVILENSALEPVMLFRFRGQAGDTGYAIQTGSSKGFDSSSVLHFRAVKERSFADCRMAVRPVGTSGGTPALVALQIVLSGDRVLARLRECREGTLKIAGRSYTVRVYAASVNGPFYLLTPETACLIDLNLDGDLTPAWHLDSSSGKLTAAEKVTLTSPFIVGGRKFIATGLDSGGTRLSLQVYAGDTYAAAGFKAPDVSFLNTSGTTSRLSDMRGKVVLITFWSTGCSYCDRIRPALNSLVEACPPSKFQAVDAALDSDVQGLHTYLRSRPYAGMIVPFDATLWQTYNRRRTTPVFFLLDQEGIIQLSGSGASLFAVVDRLTRDLLHQP